ncbi:hypothetical protein [Nocardia yunnanensis]|nr:hypothetical protein [Nocardia yunnanensis]
MNLDEYRAQLRELEADVAALAALGVVMIDVEPVSIQEIPRQVHWEK